MSATSPVEVVLPGYAIATTGPGWYRCLLCPGEPRWSATDGPAASRAHYMLEHYDGGASLADRRAWAALLKTVSRMLEDEVASPYTQDRLR